ncbi:MAG: DUF4835 family protein [Bacteroidota bacterium]
MHGYRPSQGKHLKLYSRWTFFILGLLLLTWPRTISAQELNCEVELNTNQINTTSLPQLENLASQIKTYLNDHTWTDDRFEERERIRCRFTITLLSVEGNRFTANLVVNNLRPIYNTVQQSTLMILNDTKWSFNLTQGKSFVHDLLQYDELTSVLDFYAYLILGLDYDSFGELAGTPHFTQSQTIVDIAQSAGGSGWDPGLSGFSRGKLARQLLSPTYESFRRVLYIYHRQGLDRFTTNAKAARESVLEALKLIQEVRRQSSDILLLDLFFGTKYRELASIFEDAETQLRLDAYNLLIDLDSSHRSEYERLQ